MLRATLTLLAGGALAQALPLLLGPLLTRLYTPDEFGAFHLFAAVATNLGVVACGRYEFALPLARDAGEAAALWRLALRLAAGLGVLAGLGGIGWALQAGAGWALWLGPAVAVGGLLSLATMWATRHERFRALALARVLQYGGAALAQALAGVLHGGVAGLVIAPVLAQALAALTLLAVSPRPGREATAPGLGEVARRHRDFPLLNTPHAFLGALQDTVSLALIAAALGPAAAGFWGLSLRYLKAPASLVGGAVSQALYPRLTADGAGPNPAGRDAVRRIMALLGAAALALAAALGLAGPWLFATLFGPGWREAGELARVLAPYIGAHFVAAPLAVVTMAWQAQGWALRLALWGQGAFVGALALGLHLGGLQGAGLAVSLAMLLYFGFYFWRLATWPVGETPR
ncbi:oligosaccharide flippase family protein [Sphaerotilus uruguayifluvii]|uniref:O-antigen/teichoic acid export membrane protein n=1 Tax=Sphaerotilus uruguayifluvii TaxID=2735897 RepID=A0ABX2G7B5_9BURK|nr:oligosaccharide flippase family protein [Leptothrix sp. C29]NRT58174.1 O-antigen/teichoic acid export membrane protein [Leptothrix sp. C29]